MFITHTAKINFNICYPSQYNTVCTQFVFISSNICVSDIVWKLYICSDDVENVWE